MQLVEIRQVVLRMSEYFVAFYEEHNLACYFCGGGCIEAIRSQGFIPWDDDLDFFMPRPGYGKLEVLWLRYADTERYPLLVAPKTYNDHSSLMTIRDAQTAFIKTYQDGSAIPHGTPIDIFPLDGVPKGNFRRKKQKIWALIYTLFRPQVVPEKHGGISAMGNRVLLNIFPPKKVRYHIWRFAEKRMTKYSFSSTPYVTELCVGPRYMGNIYHLEDFKSTVFVPSEDTKMPIPVGYKRYLTGVFGDYMQLPPEEDRQPYHEALIADTKKSYTEYFKK